jgi:N-acetylmuramoyl-L-alanine amidase
MKNKILRRLICSLTALLISISVFSSPLTDPIGKDTVPTGYRLKTVIIDPGHGNKHSGAGHFSPGASGSYSLERNVTLAVAFKLQKAIEKDLGGVKVVLTRTSDDDVNWQTRADIANQNKGDVFISLHCNSLADKYRRVAVGHKHGHTIYRTEEVPDRSGKGVLLLVYGTWRTKEEEKAINENLIEGDSEMNSNPDPNDPAAMILMNEYKRKYRRQSIHLAELLQNEFVDHDGRPSDGIREQGVLVLCHSAMPAVLVEMGYINNPDDEAYLNSDSGQNEIVASIVRALANYKTGLEQAAQ